MQAIESEATQSRHVAEAKQGCRLLVIDDDLSVKLLVERALDGLCSEVVSATTAAAGLEQFQSMAPDVVVLDNILPDASGIDVLKQIHQLDGATPVIFITARGTGTTAIEAMKCSAFDYLPQAARLLATPGPGVACR